MKIAGLQDDIAVKVNDNVRETYLKKFMKEVDFHHKVAYRFEKAYRMLKKYPERKAALNMEIIEIISDHSDYVNADPMSLFYCLYFCIYYENGDMVEFLRTLINKMTHLRIPALVENMLAFIDTNGIQRLRNRGERLNT